MLYAPTHPNAVHDDVATAGDDRTMRNRTMHDHRTAGPDASSTKDAASTDYGIGIAGFDSHGYGNGSDGKHRKQERTHCCLHFGQTLTLLIYHN
jgi:hypothetical protein